MSKKRNEPDKPAESDLVDSKGLAALATIGLDKYAIGLAEQAKMLGGQTASSTVGFLKEDDTSDGEFLVKLTVTVERVV